MFNPLQMRELKFIFREIEDIHECIQSKHIFPKEWKDVTFKELNNNFNESIDKLIKFFQYN